MSKIKKGELDSALNALTHFATVRQSVELKGLIVQVFSLHRLATFVQF